MSTFFKKCGVRSGIDRLPSEVNLGFKKHKHHLNNQRLFITALGNNTVEVVDLRQGKVTQTLVGFSEPQGILFVQATRKLYVANVANGGNGVCAIFDGDTLQSPDRVNVAGDADNLRYNANRQQIVVGYGNGAIGLIDGKSDNVTPWRASV